MSSGRKQQIERTRLDRQDGSFYLFARPKDGGKHKLLGVFTREETCRRVGFAVAKAFYGLGNIHEQTNGFCRKDLPGTPELDIFWDRVIVDDVQPVFKWLRDEVKRGKDTD